MNNPMSTLGNAGKSILMVLFVPSVERDGKKPIDQEYWVNEALRETNQGEVGMVVDNHYIAFTDFSDEE